MDAMEQLGGKRGYLSILKKDTLIVFARTCADMPPPLALWLKASRLIAWSVAILAMTGITIDLCDDFIFPLDPTLLQVDHYMQKLALPALVVLGIAFSYFHVGRVRRRVWDVDYKLCIHCGYCLRGLTDEGKCPECGEKYDLVQTRDAWRKWFGEKCD